MRIFRKNNSGIILFIVLWALVILTVLAVSLGRSTNIELALTKNAIGKLQSKYLAWAGVSLAMAQIAVDSKDEDLANVDSLYQCAIAGDAAAAQKIFEKYELGEGYFSLQYKGKDADGKKVLHYALEDEERKIDINTLTQPNYLILKQLMVALEVESSLAEEITANIVDWVDADQISVADQQSDEKDLYTSEETGYLPKNRPFDSLEELMLVSKMDDAIFNKIKNYLTIYPKEGGFKINFDTASPTVLLAVFQSQTGASTNTDESDAKSLVEKVLTYRAGDDGVEATTDDRLIEVNSLSLNAKERVIYDTVASYQTRKSNFIHVHAKGVIPHRTITTEIDAVIARENLLIAGWRRF